MLTHKDNELICRVGPDTPQGKAHRRYWMPACQVSDLEEMNGSPRRIRLLGEAFVLFRTPEGVLGFVDENCAHRGVSLMTGRVESGGIRCIFHGWKFAPDGETLEIPNEINPDFKKNVRAKSYPVREAGGLIWVYIGPQDKIPKFPEHRWFDVDKRHRLNAYLVENSNYVQVLEALMDTSHVNILHQDAFQVKGATDVAFGSTVGKIMSDAAPEIVVEDTEFGYLTAAIRAPGADGKRLVRTTSYIAPFQVYNANGDLWMAVIPIDDYNSVYYHVWWSTENAVGEDPYASTQLKFIGLDKKALTDFCLTHETLESPNKPSFKNGFHQNREAIRRGWSFSGFHSLSQEDAGVIMSAGALKDRSNEHLCSADGPIRYMYRTLMYNAKAIEKGLDPIGLELNHREIFAANAYLDDGEDWRKLAPSKKAFERKPL